MAAVVKPRVLGGQPVVDFEMELAQEDIEEFLGRFDSLAGQRLYLSVRARGGRKGSELEPPKCFHRTVIAFDWRVMTYSGVDLGKGHDCW